MTPTEIDRKALLLRKRLIALWGSTPVGFQQVDAWLKWVVNLMGGEVYVYDWTNPRSYRGSKLPFRVSAFSSNDNFDIAGQIGVYAFDLMLGYERRRFASTFLMPPDEFREVYLAGSYDLYRVAGHFGCPYAAVVVTAERLITPPRIP